MVKSKSQYHALTQTSPTKPAGVVNHSSLVEKHVGKMLTQGQRQIVFQASKELSLRHTPLTPEQLQQEIEFTLLDPHAYTKAGKEFFKKLNTIKKAIREHKWRPSVRYGARNRTSSASVNHIPDDPMKALKSGIQRLNLKRNGEIHAIDTSPMVKNHPKFKAMTQKPIDEYSKRINKFKQALSNTYRVQKHAI
jgi:hypothetical protein